MNAACCSLSHRRSLRSPTAIAAAFLCLFLIGRPVPAVAQVRAGPVIAGTVAYVLIGGIAFEIHVRWSLDGRTLAVRHFGPTWGIWTVDMVTRETAALTYGPSVAYPAWAPEGGRLVYAEESEGQWDLQMVDPRTGDHIRQVTDDDVVERWPVWVDEWHIAFLPFDYTDGAADRGLQIIDLTGRDRGTVPLADGGGHIAAFSWVDPSRDVTAKGMDVSAWANLKQKAGSAE